MSTETQIRKRLLKKIQQIPPEKLKELEDFLSQFEKAAGNKEKILSYAGAWEQIDQTVFEDLTEYLIEKREGNTRRRNEQGAD
jgi:hypothetical protein